MKIVNFTIFGAKVVTYFIQKKKNIFWYENFYFHDFGAKVVTYFIPKNKCFWRENCYFQNF